MDLSREFWCGALRCKRTVVFDMRRAEHRCYDYTIRIVRERKMQQEIRCKLCCMWVVLSKPGLESFRCSGREHRYFVPTLRPKYAMRDELRSVLARQL